MLAAAASRFGLDRVNIGLVSFLVNWSFLKVPPLDRSLIGRVLCC
jgi:hypothetical protein